MGIVEHWLDGRLRRGEEQVARELVRSYHAGICVPYRIRLQDGGAMQSREYRLALRNENKAQRRVIDGGI